jgi:5'-deoxynucleotidase YfbR-like HD superfamily hydrolase
MDRKESEMIREKVYASRHLAGMVRRYATWPMIHQQTVGEHSWRVACIFVEIFGMPRAEALYAALHHDSGELWSGDLPFGVKKAVPNLSTCMKVAEQIGLQKLDLKLPDLTALECVQIKIADLLEMWERGIIEQQMGNGFAAPIINDTLEAAQELAGLHCQSEKVNKWLMGK